MGDRFQNRRRALIDASVEHRLCRPWGGGRTGSCCSDIRRVLQVEEVHPTPYGLNRFARSVMENESDRRGAVLIGPFDVGLDSIDLVGVERHERRSRSAQAKPHGVGAKRQV